MMITLVHLGVFPLLTLSQRIPLLHPQTDTWNSSVNLPPAQIAGSNLSTNQTANIELTLDFERSNWATGSTAQDDFYTAQPNASSLPPGSIIKVQSYVNTTTYTLPPNTALSRILYTTVNLLNETIPASAYVLWPFLPLEYPNLTNPSSENSTKYPVVAWAHGTSGIFSECAPSHIRNLWYQYSAPYTLALSGYVVVAPDYQGLGANITFNGSTIVHPYLSAAPAANDLFYAVQAAQEAFSSKLAKEFVVMGHSQGGSAAWGAAVRQANEPIDGYLGAIAASPPTNLTGLIAALGGIVPPTLGLFWSEAVRALYPNFDQSTVLTNEGQARLGLAREQGMCNSAITALLSDFPMSDNGTLLKKGWAQTPEIAAFLRTADLGTQSVAGPMLVLQGTADGSVPYQFTDVAVSETCMANSGGGITYERFEGVSHVPVLYASQRIWLGWLNEQFENAGMRNTGEASDCVTRNHTSQAWPVENYQKELGYFLELATQGYQVA